MVLRRAAVIVALAMVATACHRPDRVHGVQTVVLVTIDTLRADAVGAYGGAAATPTLDRLAAEGLRFSHARSHVPITSPSHAAIFTSRLPSDVGLLNNGRHLADDATTLAELVQASGRGTAAFTSLGTLKRGFGFEQGFDHYADCRGDGWFCDADQVNREVGGWLAGDPDRPGLLWVHYSDPHEPYAPPDRSYPTVRVAAAGGATVELACDGRLTLVPLPAAATAIRFRPGSRPPAPEELVTVRDVRSTDGAAVGRGDGMFGWSEDAANDDYVTRLPGTLQVAAADDPAGGRRLRFTLDLKRTPAATRTAYRWEVEFVDAALGRLLARLDRLGWLEDSLVVVTSDHGEGLGDHDLVGHVHQLYDSLLAVPLILWSPGLVPAGEVDDRPSRLVDLLPTMAPLLGLPTDPAWRGRSLLAAPPAAPAVTVAATYRPQAREDVAAVVWDRHKLIWHRRTGTVELFDLTADPAEVHDLAGSVSRTTEVEAALTAAGLPSFESLYPAADLSPVDHETAVMLEELGYASQ